MVLQSIESYLSHPTYKINSIWIKDLNAKAKLENV